jgi:Mor family transcriptional regulator
MRRQRRQYPEVLAEIAIQVTRLMVAKGEEEQEAMAFGFEVAEFIRRHWSGQAVYIPKGHHFTLSKRDQEILKEFDGSNRGEICRKHGITARRFYQILNANRLRGKAPKTTIDEEEQ